MAKAKLKEVDFWSRVDKQSNDKCWKWIGSRSTYGSFGRHGYAHRVSWEIHFGPIPDGFWVLHHCDNKLCVNPNHLYLGKHINNVEDCLLRKSYRPLHKKSTSSKETQNGL